MPDEIHPNHQSVAGSHERLPYEQQPPPEAMRTALRRIRTRRNDARTMNELFEAFASLGRALATLFGSENYKNGGRHG